MRELIINIIEAFKYYHKRIVHMLKYPYNKILYKEYHYTTIIMSCCIITPKYIRCGNNVYIGHNARIQGVDCYKNVSFKPAIVLKDGVSIQQNVHITCADRIVIGQNTAIASNVSITDIHHPYNEIETPIEGQDIEVTPVSIGDDCKIYNNAVILPGVKIGKHVTIGANAVVNKNIPDYCVAVGIPAKIVKRYNFETKCWERTDQEGLFIK